MTLTSFLGVFAYAIRGLKDLAAIPAQSNNSLFRVGQIFNSSIVSFQLYPSYFAKDHKLSSKLWNCF